MRDLEVVDSELRLVGESVTGVSVRAMPYPGR
jgi:hypothetical protein